MGISFLSLKCEDDNLSPTTVISTCLMPLDWWDYLVFGYGRPGFDMIAQTNLIEGF